MSAFDEQIGGDHYSRLAIQPMEYSLKNGLNAAQHTAIKYITRYKDKAGKTDLEKAIHTIRLLIDMEYPVAAIEYDTEHDIARSLEIRGRLEK